MNETGSPVLFPRVLDMDGCVLGPSVSMNEQTPKALFWIATKDPFLTMEPEQGVVDAAKAEWLRRYPTDDSRSDRPYGWQTQMDQLVPTGVEYTLPVAS